MILIFINNSVLSQNELEKHIVGWFMIKVIHDQIYDRIWNINKM